jgi:hypothetical protein
VSWRQARFLRWTPWGLTFLGLTFVLLGSHTTSITAASTALSGVLLIAVDWIARRLG